jgi:Sugar (and other) transporter
LVTLTFLPLVTVFTAAGVFLLYAIVSIAAFLFVWRGVPETKDRTLEEIEKFWLSKSLNSHADWPARHRELTSK